MGLREAPIDPEWGALGARLEAVRPKLLRLLRPSDQTWDDAEDCVQEAFFRLLRCYGSALADWAEPRLYAYLKKVTLRCLSRPLHGYFVQVNGLTIDLADTAPGPEQQLLQRVTAEQQSRLARCALYRLPMDRRHLIRDWQRGPDWPEIARIHQISEWAARKRFERSRHAMCEFVTAHDQSAPTLYHLPSSRLEQITACHPALEESIVRAFCLADWPEGDSHQDWLESAPVEEIADWILTLVEN